MAPSRTALVVGASIDIGSAIVRGLVAVGFTCVAWGRNRARLPDESADFDEVDLRSPDSGRPGLSRLPDRLAAVVYAAGLFDWAPADAGTPEVRRAPPSLTTRPTSRASTAWPGSWPAAHPSCSCSPATWPTQSAG